MKNCQVFLKPASGKSAAKTDDSAFEESGKRIRRRSQAPLWSGLARVFNERQILEVANPEVEEETREIEAPIALTCANRGHADTRLWSGSVSRIRKFLDQAPPDAGHLPAAA